MLCRVDERTLEIHCHGGNAALRRILDDLQTLGAVLLPGSEWDARAHGPLHRECLDVLSRTRTLRGAEYALEQAGGLLAEHFRKLCARAQRAAKATDFQQLQSDVEKILQWAPVGRLLTQPARVVLCGRPNVGKSCLMNALLDYSRSIVFDQPGTTRDIVTAETAIDGWPLEFIDTAGIRSAEEALESAGIRRTKEALSTAACCVLLLDVSQPPGADDFRLLRALPGAIVVAHKCDLPPAWNPEDLRRTQVSAECPLAVSSKTGEGQQSLQRVIVNRCVPRTPPPGTPIPLTPRQIHWLEKSRQAAVLHDRNALLQALQKLLC